MREKNIPGCIVFTVLICTSIPSIVRAQKLPNVQEKSLHAPSIIRIDGKDTEWNNQFQAYNKATEVFYALSNDKDKLYLTVQATDQDIANKIINAGITFTINGSGKAKDEGGMAITFPFLYRDDHRLNLPLLDYNKDAAIMNQQLTDKTKDIRIAGIKGIKDTISIYNPEGIKVAALFDKDKVFTWEMAIPLKYLELSVNQPESFVYSIKLNGTANYTDSNRINQRIAVTHVQSYLRSGIKGIINAGDNHILSGPTAIKVTSLISPTDFSGEYTLAK